MERDCESELSKLNIEQNACIYHFGASVIHGQRSNILRLRSWRNNWTQLSTYFKYPSEIRKLIYTTNSIENFNRQLRKVTKSKTIFPTDDALFKMLYLAMMDATKKWTGKTWDWGLTLDQLCIYFGDRIQPEDID